MVAPNGARLNQTDHRAIPVTVQQTIRTACECRDAGARALHAHVRDTKQRHCLDAVQYRALLDLAQRELGPEFPVQITTEAVDRYTPQQQIELMKTLKPRFASVALREMMTTDLPERQAQAFYSWAKTNQIGIQHILYEQAELGADSDIARFHSLKNRGVIAADSNAVLVVLGRYTDSRQADVNDAGAVADRLSEMQLDWMLCAFGQAETECLVTAALHGGAMRIGFENNRLHANGQIAKNNAERVTALSSALQGHLIEQCDDDQLHRLLGGW